MTNESDLFSTRLFLCCTTVLSRFVVSGADAFGYGDPNHALDSACSVSPSASFADLTIQVTDPTGAVVDRAGDRGSLWAHRGNRHHQQRCRRNDPSAQRELHSYFQCSWLREKVSRGTSSAQRSPIDQDGSELCYRYRQRLRRQRLCSL